jgi:transketolase
MNNNHITIEGNTSLAFSEDVAGRFLAYRWNVQRVSNANDLDLLREAFDHFKKTTDRPTLIIVDSHIGYGVQLNRIRVRHTANRSAPRRSGRQKGVTAGQRMRNFWFLRK